MCLFVYCFKEIGTLCCIVCRENIVLKALIYSKKYPLVLNYYERFSQVVLNL